MARVIGIDPGLTGAVCVLNGKTCEFHDTPIMVVLSGGKKRTRYQPEQMALLLRPWENCDAVVALELVHAMPQQGTASMFSMGFGYGLWRGIAAGLCLAVESVTPQAWKRAMLGKGAGADKNASILRACTLFPQAAPYLSRKMDHGRAEALLLAAYLRDYRR